MTTNDRIDAHAAQPLTAEGIEAMEAGAQLDILIARHIFGLVVRDNAITCRNCAEAGEDYAVMPYSSEISAAWEVVEKLKEVWTVSVAATMDNWFKYECYLYTNRLNIITLKEITVSRQESAPLAICKAALLAKLAAA